MKNNKTLTALVKNEAANLKKFATKEELKNLNFSKLNPDDPDSCIYGQVTGNCFSNRALELIKKCAPKMYEGGGVNNAEVNGRFNSKLRGTGTGGCYHWSPIEVFIDIEENEKAANKKLISYLKGETKTLKI